MAHGAGLGHRMRKVGHGERSLRLTEALEDSQPRVFLPEVEQVGVERLTGGSTVRKRAQIMGIHVGLHHHAVHGGRAAQRGDPVARNQIQDLVGMETVEVVREHAGFHEPLAIILAPHGFAPAGVGDGQMQPVRLDVVPVLRRDQVRQCVVGIMQHHLGVAGGAGGEIHEHGVADMGFHAGEFLAGIAHAGVEIMPALTLRGHGAHALEAGEHSSHRAVSGKPIAIRVLLGQAPAGAIDQKQVLNRRTAIHDVVHHLCDGADGGADDSLDGSAVQAILQVVLLEHERCRNHDGAEFGERGCHEPELVMAAQDHHDHVALTHAVRSKVVRRLVRPAFHVGEREQMLLAFRVAPHHGAAIGVVVRDVVHHVIAEVEGIGALHLEIGEHALLVVGFLAVTQIDASHGVAELP